MNISKIKISNILGIKYLEYEAGQFNEVSGENGSGKTSVIESLKAVFESGNDVTLIRNGQEKGEIGLELSDGSQIIKSYSDKAELKIYDPAGSRIKKSPASYLEKLADMISINPVAFLNADKKNRTNILLESLPLKLHKDDLRGVDEEYYSNLNLQFMHALESLELIRKGIFDERTGINRVIKDKDATVKELQDGLNEASYDPTMDYSASIEELEKLKGMMENKMRVYIEEFDDAKNKALEELRNLKSKSIAIAEENYQYALANIQRIRNEEIRDIESVSEIQKEEIFQNDAKARAERTNAYNQKYNPLCEQLITAKERQKLLSGYQKQNELIMKFVEEREEAKEKAESLSMQLATLEQIKTSLLSSLPIDGLEIIEGQIYRHGIIFDRLNTAQQIEIAVEIAKLRAGELGIICVDGIERFDNATLEAFKEKSLQSNLQLFVTKVGDGELKINGQIIKKEF